MNPLRPHHHPTHPRVEQLQRSFVWGISEGQDADLRTLRAIISDLSGKVQTLIDHQKTESERSIFRWFNGMFVIFKKIEDIF